MRGAGALPWLHASWVVMSVRHGVVLTGLPDSACARSAELHGANPQVADALAGGVCCRLPKPGGSRCQ